MYSIAGSSVPPIAVLDLGARDIGDRREPYADLPSLVPGSRVIGVDAAQDGEHPDGWEARRAVIARGAGRRKFYHTTWAMADSLYPLNEWLLHGYCGLEPLRVVGSEEVQTITLDQFTGPLCRPVHLLRADIQGAELEAFEGGKETLADVLVVVTEVAYAPVYIGGPLFRDIDGALSERGFAFYGPLYSAFWHERPFVMEGQRFRQRSPMMPGGRMLWGDVIYVRTDLDSLDGDALRRLACLAHLYGLFTLAASCMDRYAGRSAAERYLSGILNDDENGPDDEKETE